jgi:hypothetical protein
VREELRDRYLRCSFRILFHHIDIDKLRGRQGTLHHWNVETRLLLEDDYFEPPKKARPAARKPPARAWHRSPALVVRRRSHSHPSDGCENVPKAGRFEKFITGIEGRIDMPFRTFGRGRSRSVCFDERLTTRSLALSTNFDEPDDASVAHSTCAFRPSSTRRGVRLMFTRSHRDRPASLRVPAQ